MNHRHVSQIEADLDEATGQVRQLKDDLQKKQTYIMKLEADAIGNAVCNSQQMSTENIYNNVFLTMKYVAIINAFKYLTDR